MTSPTTGAGEVLAVLGELTAASVPHWVAGGWGVDALAGRVTRQHRDLDLLIDARYEAAALAVLAGRGMVVETDWRPVRVELAGARGRVDIHPVIFGPDGVGVQAGLDGASFRYRPEDLGVGRLGGVEVPCLTAALQDRLHRGYPPRPVDLADLTVLRSLLGAAARGSG